MQLITISKDKLLTKIKENRNLHRKQFEEALLGWEKRVLKELERAVEDARSGKQFRTFINLPQPTDHTPEYDEIIDQIEWNEEQQIELDLHSFNQFVRDDWGWKKDFLTNATMYANTETWR